MKKREKKSIDDLFREGLGNSDEPFSQAHWTKLERMMDRRKGRYWLRGAGIFFLVSAILSALYVGFDDRMESSAPTSRKQKPAIATLTPNQSETSLKSQDETKQSLLEPGDSKPGSVAGAKSSERLFLQDKLPGKPMSSGEEKQKLLTLIDSGRGERKLPTDRVEEKNYINSAESATINKDADAPITEKNDSIATGVLPVSPSQESKAGEKEPDPEKMDVLFPEPQKTPVTEKEKKRKRISLGSLTVLVGPDLTSIRGAGKVRFSQNFGVLYSQPVGKRLSLSTGILYARKKYASPYSYYNPENPPILAEYPKEVSAVCDVIDVPVLLNLNLLDNAKTRLSIGAGVSSYFMLKEKYRFAYEGSGRYGKQDGTYEISGQNQHIFGVADFSVSVERKLADRITLGVRPFIKVPLTGIGYGQIMLESKGIAITLGIELKKNED